MPSRAAQHPRRRFTLTRAAASSGEHGARDTQGVTAKFSAELLHRARDCFTGADGAEAGQVNLDQPEGNGAGATWPNVRARAGFAQCGGSSAREWAARAFTDKCAPALLVVGVELLHDGRRWRCRRQRVVGEQEKGEFGTWRALAQHVPHGGLEFFARNSGLLAGGGVHAGCVMPSRAAQHPRRRFTLMRAAASSGEHGARGTQGVTAKLSAELLHRARDCDAAVGASGGC